MPEEPHIEPIWPAASGSTLEMPLSAGAVSEKKVARGETTESPETRKLRLEFEKHLTDTDAIIADKDAIIAKLADQEAKLADKDALIVALTEQIESQGGTSTPFFPSRQLLSDPTEPIESTPPLPRPQKGSCSQVAVHNLADTLPWTECPVGLLGEATESDKCAESNYGFLKADGKAWVKGAWSRAISVGFHGNSKRAEKYQVLLPSLIEAIIFDSHVSSFSGVARILKLRIPMWLSGITPRMPSSQM